MQEESLLQHYITVPNVYSCQPLQTGEQFTFISNETGIPTVWKGDINGNISSYGTYPDRVLAVHHSPSGNKAIIEIDEDGNEKAQFYIQNYEDETVRKLVFEPHYFHKFGGWSPNGKSICFSSNRRHPGYFDIFTMDVETQQLTTVLEYDGICEPICWLKDGEHLLIRVNETNIEHRLYKLSILTGHVERIDHEKLLASYDDIQLTADGKGAYVLTNIGEEMMFIGYLQFDEPTKIQKVYGDEFWDIEALVLNEQAGKLAFTINKGGYSELAYVDLETKIVQKLETLPLSVIESLHWLNDQTLLFTLKAATIPGDVWCYQLEQHVFKRLTEVSREQQVEADWVTPILHSFASFDNLQVPYFLYSKGETEGKPVVVYVHGGPESQIRSTYNPVIQYLAASGFVVVAPNVRGSRGYGRTYIKLDDGMKRLDAVQDLACLVDHLANVHAIDREHVGVVGRSYGGFMVLASLTHYPEIWKAGVNIVGISHFTSFLENTGPWRRRLRECEYGTLVDHREFFEEISPLRLAANIQAPLLVFHGKNDTRVPVSEAEQLVQGMRDRGQSVELTVFEDEGHQTEKLENVLTMHGETIRFFEQQLKE